MKAPVGGFQATERACAQRKMAEFYSDKFRFARFTLSAARCAGSGTLYLPQWQFRIILQGDIPNQRTLIFDIAAIAAGAKIIVHTA